MATGDLDLISTAEAAAILNKSIWTVLRMVASGKLTPAAQAPGPKGARMYHRNEVLALAEPEAVAG